MLCQVCHEKPATFRCNGVMVTNVSPLETAPMLTYSCQSCVLVGMEVNRRLSALLGQPFPFQATLETTLQYREEPA
jgi:protein-arginine kinase activator protein McsA